MVSWHSKGYERVELRHKHLHSSQILSVALTMLSAVLSSQSILQGYFIRTLSLVRCIQEDLIIYHSYLLWEIYSALIMMLSSLPHRQVYFQDSGQRNFMLQPRCSLGL